MRNGGANPFGICFSEYVRVDCDIIQINEIRQDFYHNS